MNVATRMAILTWMDLDYGLKMVYLIYPGFIVKSDLLVEMT
jgi:hypothetical protein